MLFHYSVQNDDGSGERMMENLPERPKELKEEIFKLLFDSAEISSFAVNEQKNYEEDMTTERDLRNQLAFAKKEGREEGLAEGEAKGIAKGRADGITEGIAKGKVEGKAEGKAEIARKLLAEGLDVDFVSKTCGLSIDEVKSLTK